MKMQTLATNCFIRPGRIVIPVLLTVLGILFFAKDSRGQEKQAPLISAGFAQADITPKLGKKPVYIAGFGQNRIATKVHDPLMARVVVLKDHSKKIALASVDVVGLFFDSVQKVRNKLPGFDYVLVSSTHNHEGPDTLGLWGPNPFQSGVDPAYLQEVEEQIVKAIKDADQALQPVETQIATVELPELVRDTRLPEIKHATLVALSFSTPDKKRRGIVVQWNNHPETLSSKNTEISADFVAGTVGHLQKRFQCPVVYFTGTVGGLMTTLGVPVKDAKGNSLKDGTFEKTILLGEMVGKGAENALAKPASIKLAPIQVHTQKVFLPIDNPLYVAGWQMGVFKRQSFLWKGDPYKAGPVIQKKIPEKERVCLESEVGLLSLGQLEIAAIPGEIYPELVLDKVQNPADPNADYPDAPIEPAIYKQMKGPYRMLIGLANDELGYIIPKRQWDAKAPFCYGLKKSQYGEINSLGPDTAPLICAAFQSLTKGK